MPEKNTLNEVYLQKIQKAEKFLMTMFIFKYDGKLYLVEYRYPKWDTPSQIYCI